MDNNYVGTLTVWILLYMFINGCHARVNYNITECQQCSLQNEVPCRIEVMRDSCLSAMTAIHGKVWPGPPRELTAVGKQVKNETQAQFSWKPPYDASIHSLKGFLLRITTYEDNKGSFVAGTPWCFFLNLTNSNWTDSVNAYDTTFQFNCIKSQYPARVTLSVSSIPRPHKEWKVVQQGVLLLGTVPYYNWKPDIYITETGDVSSHCVNVAVQPPFPEAFSHDVCLTLNERLVETASFQFPDNNVTLCLSPGENYSIQVKPFSKNGNAMSHFVQYGPIRLEANGITTVMSPVPTSSNHTKRLQVMTWVIVPLILVIVIALTAFAFYRRGKLHLCDLSSKSKVVLPPRKDEIEGQTIIAIVYCAENCYVENVVNSLAKIIKDSIGGEIELISDGGNIEIHKKPLFVITEGIHRLNHMYPNVNPCSYTASRAFVSGNSFLQRFRNAQEGNQCVILLSPIVSFNWLDCCIFKNKNVPRMYQISDTENVDLDLGQTAIFLHSLCEGKSSENIRSKLNENPEVITLKNHLLQLYLYMRDNQKWFEDDFLGSCGDDDSQQTQPLLPYSVPLEVPPQEAQYIDTLCLKNQSPNECSGYYQIQPQVQQTQMFVEEPNQVQYCPTQLSHVNEQLEKILQGKQAMNDPDNFDSGISEQEIKFEMCEKKDDRLDSGMDSIPLEEEVPLFAASPPEFIPPESDCDSLDVDAQSLGQHMLDINKYHLHA